MSALRPDPGALRSDPSALRAEQGPLQPEQGPRSPAREEPRDLGFGSAASRSHQRLLERDGSFRVRRRGVPYWRSLSLYHSLLTLSWPRFLALVAALYLATNVLFALGFWACGADALVSPEGDMGRGFERAFFFSVQTFSTIGYGHISPRGAGPNVLITLESLTGLLGFTLITGLLFARFARPTVNIRFSERALIAPYRGGQALMLRIANVRASQILDLSAKLFVARNDPLAGTSNPGARRFDVLTLERSQVGFFPLSWTLVHPIDEASPLWQQDDASLRASRAEFFVLLTGFDESFSQTVHARSSYLAEEIVWGARFSDVFIATGADEPLTIDVSRLSEFERTG